MNAGPEDKGLSPYVSDLEIEYEEKNKAEWHDAYGPFNARVLTNWVDDDPQWSGYFTQRNADNYAWFALAKYVEKEIGEYPSGPSTGGKQPISEPLDANTHLPPQSSAPRPGQHTDPKPGEEQDPDAPDEVGCGDKVGPEIAQADTAASLSSLHAAKATPTPAPKSDPKCDETALSGVPYNVFGGTTGSVFGNFCNTVGKAQQTKLTWNVDSSGKQKTTTRRRHRRTPPPNPNSYTSFNFELDWAPTSGACNTDCNSAYQKIATSPCGHQGGEQNGMTASASLDVGCGTYSYKITGSNVPTPEGPPAPSLSAQYCLPLDDFGSHGDIEPEWQAEYTGLACANSANENFKPGDQINWNTTTNGVPYNYNIWWKDGCTSSVSPMNVYQPLVGNKEVNCIKIMQNNYKNCHNNGIGGSVSVGCLTYEFKASMTPAGKFS